MTESKLAIRKALIPIAGRGTRLMPVTSVVPKAMFPLVDGENCIRSVLHIILEETKSAGIEHVGIVAAPTQIEMAQRYFDAVGECGLSTLPTSVEYIAQISPKGFGDAVMQAGDFIRDEPFMLLLGDHIHIEQRGKPPCAAQVADAFVHTDGMAMIGVQYASTEELAKVGVACGVEIRRNIYRCTDFVEKPDLPTAQQRLVMKGMPKNTFLAHCGIYIFAPRILDCLTQVGTKMQKTNEEIELASAQILLLKRYPAEYFLCTIAGRAYDIGTPTGYASAQAAFRKKTAVLQTS